jgi:hypothetical protein
MQLPEIIAGACIKCAKPVDVNAGGAVIAAGPVCVACRTSVLQDAARAQDPNWTPAAYDEAIQAALDPDNDKGPATILDLEEDAKGLYIVTRHRDGPAFCQKCMGLFDDRDLDRRPVIVPMGKTRQQLHAKCASGAHDVREPGPSIVIDLGRDMGRSMIEAARKAEQRGAEAGRNVLKKLGF